MDTHKAPVPSPSLTVCLFFTSLYRHTNKRRERVGSLWPLRKQASKASPLDRVEFIGAGSLGYGTGPSFG